MRDERSRTLGAISSIALLTFLVILIYSNEILNLCKHITYVGYSWKVSVCVCVLLTWSPGVELKSPATIIEGEQSNFFDTSILNCARRESKYLACAIFTSAHSGSLQQFSIILNFKENYAKVLFSGCDRKKSTYQYKWVLAIITWWNVGSLSLKAAMVPTQSRFNLTRGSLGSPRSDWLSFPEPENKMLKCRISWHQYIMSLLYMQKNQWLPNILWIVAWNQIELWSLDLSDIKQPVFVRTPDSLVLCLWFFWILFFFFIFIFLF